jgi:glycosyltransferase involved in cell wall biosynthesis
MRRLVFLNRFFFPDHSATSRLLTDLAFHLAARGLEIHVITSRQLYTSPGECLPAQEIVNGVRIHRVQSTGFGREALPGRVIDSATFYRSTRRRALSVARSGDVLVAMTDPPLLSFAAMRVARRTGAHLVNWLHDLYPEIAAQLRVPLMAGALGRSFAYFRDLSLQSAGANVVVGQLMAQRVKSRGIAAERVHLIPNWSDDEHISPVSHADNPLRRSWGLADKFVVGYSGNLGRAHEFETVLSAAERLRGFPIVFLFVGGGHQFDRLAQRARQRELRNFQFMPYQDAEALKYSLGVADIHIVSLRAELEGLSVPSKFYGVAAAGRPTVAIGSSDGEIARLVRQHASGLVIESGNGEKLAQELIVLMKEPQRTVEMGARARTMLDAHFARKHALARWQELLTRTAQHN